MKMGLEGLFLKTLANAGIFVLLQKTQEVEGTVRMCPGDLTAVEREANSRIGVSLPCALRTVAISRPERF